MQEKALVSESVSSASGSSWWNVGRVVVLVAGDVASFLVFASAGRTSHHEVGASSLANLLDSVATAVPFMLGWFLVSPFVGAFRRSRTIGLKKMFARTELAWLCSYPAALILRVLIAPDHQMPLTFAIVIFISNAIFLGLWRSAFALVERLLMRSR